MGRIRKPNEVHLLEGTDRKERGTNTLIALEGELSAKPILQDFSAIDDNKVFTQVSAWVKNLTGQAKIDELAISMLVDQFNIYSLAKNSVKDDGVMLQGEKGKYVNPQLYNMNTAHDKIMKVMREYGLTPATRSGIKASDQMESNPLQNLLKGRG